MKKKMKKKMKKIRKKSKRQTRKGPEEWRSREIDRGGRSKYLMSVASLAFLRIGLEGDVKAVVHLGDVLVQVFANCWEFVSRYSNHAQFPNLSTSPEIEQRQRYHANLLI